jgi:hypothetical protein
VVNSIWLGHRQSIHTLLATRTPEGPTCRLAPGYWHATSGPTPSQASPSWTSGASMARYRKGLPISEAYWTTRVAPHCFQPRWVHLVTRPRVSTHSLCVAFLTESTLHRSMCVVIPHEEYSALSYTRELVSVRSSLGVLV